MSKYFGLLLYLISLSIFAQNDLYNAKAKEIITKVILNKDANSNKKFNSVTYNNYSKIIFSAFDSLISDKIDVITDYRLKSFLKTRADSTSYKFKQEIQNKHFFIAEKIAKYEYANQKEKETILAVKMAGFKKPVYEFIPFGVSGIDYYKNKLDLFGESYVSPLANNALNDYKYTLIKANQSNYIIHFKSEKRKKSVGLKGVLYIDKKTFALTKVITEINGKINVKISQNYIFKKDRKHWFIDETNILLTKGTSETSIKAFRVLIGFRPKYSVSKFNPEDVSYVKITSKNTGFEINKPIRIKRKDYAIIIENAATNRTSKQWNNHFQNDLREQRTYQFLDSVVKEHHVERKLTFLRKFSEGLVNTHYFDIDLTQIITFNNHEGLRLGFGGSSNTSLSSLFKINGYAAYGNRDKKIKYNYGIGFLIDTHSNTWIKGSYTNDLFESATPRLLFESSKYYLQNPRTTNISLFYNYQTTAIGLDHDITPNFITKTQFSFGQYSNLFDYSFISRTKLLHDYNLTNLSFAFEWTPLSKYMKTPIGKFSVKKEFPKINVEVTKSFDNLLDGDFNYIQGHLKINHEIKTIRSGSTQFLLKAGYIYGEAPFSHLYNHGSNYSLKTPWINRINFSGTDNFETMLFNEFISDKYASIQMRQNFEKFRIGPNFKPKLSLVTRYTLGTLKNPINHQGVKFKTLQKGYVESGLILNQLFYGIGLSGYYRYGPHAFKTTKDNIALKITYVFDF